MSRLPSLDALCPYCAAWPSSPCNEAVQGFLYGYVHVGGRDWDDLYALTLVTEGLVAYAETLAGGTVDPQ